MFQSLLSWIWLAEYIPKNSPEISIVFQSLLSWIWLAEKFAIGWRSGSGRSFNPCCRGSGSLSGSSHSHRIASARVSILVVVDLVR